MALFRRRQDGTDSTTPALVVRSLAGREDLLPDFSHPIDGEEVVVGRDDGCGIQVADRQISRRHFCIRRATGGSHRIEDLGSANGTFVNSRRLELPVTLAEGDTIEVGDSRLVFTRRKFADHATALRHFRTAGENVKGTLLKNDRRPG